MSISRLDDIAHAIVNGKRNIIDVLKNMGLPISDDADEESTLRMVLEHKEDERIQAGLKGVLKKNPFNRHCFHCFEPIKEIYEKGRQINREIKQANE